MQTEATSTESQQSATDTSGTQTNTQTAQDAKAAETGQQTGNEGVQTGQGESEQQEQQRNQHRNKVQDRINELTFKRNQAEREAAHWKSIAESRQAPAAPKASDFATDDDYHAALLDHRVQSGVQYGLAENAKETANKFSKDAAAAAAETYNQRVKDTVQRLPDFIDVVGKSDIRVSDELAHALMMDSEIGPDIIYHLAKNPGEAERLSQLSGKQLHREIWNMEANLGSKASASAPAARTTNAPPPIKPGSAASAPANNDPSKMSQQQYEAWRKAAGSKYIR